MKKMSQKHFFVVVVPNRMAKDPRFDRLPCMHKGTYADDCIVNRIQQVNIASEDHFVVACASKIVWVVHTHILCILGAGSTVDL